MTYRYPPVLGRTDDPGRPAAGLRRRSGRVRGALTALTLLAVSAPAGLGAQEAKPGLPFAAGEELVYRVKTSRFGEVGRGVMMVVGPERVRERSALLLRFDMRTKVGPFSAEDRTRSWVDPERMAALRYHKREKSPLSSRREDVEVFPEERRWTDAKGDTGRTLTDAPLDELSALYFIRTLPLSEGAVYTFLHHYDPVRNPMVVSVLGRERLSVPAGEFLAVAVEMRVKDPGRFGGDGVIRLYLTDDARRVPIRIRTSMPVVGSVVMDLVSLPAPALAGSLPAPAAGIGSGQ